MAAEKAVDVGEKALPLVGKVAKAVGGTIVKGAKAVGKFLGKIFHKKKKKPVRRCVLR